LKYECSYDHHSNVGAFYTGGQAYFARYLLIALITQYILDYYHATAKVSEFWQPARYQYSSGIDYDIHNPYTDAYNQILNANQRTELPAEGLHPMAAKGKSSVILI
jgi:hypothetical protein